MVFEKRRARASEVAGEGVTYSGHLAKIRDFHGGAVSGLAGSQRERATVL
jgi:hypothetical protein